VWESEIFKPANQCHLTSVERILWECEPAEGIRIVCIGDDKGQIRAVCYAQGEPVSVIWLYSTGHTAYRYTVPSMRTMGFSAGLTATLKQKGIKLLPGHWQAKDNLKEIA